MQVQVIVLLLLLQILGGGGKQYSCFPLQEPWWSDGRFDVSGCVGQQQNVPGAVDCDGGYTRIGGTSSCSCLAPWTTVSTWPACALAALAPSTPEVLSKTATTLTVRWQDLGLNDCGEGAWTTTFTAWEVAYQPLDGAWATATGECASLTCADLTQCTITGLTANTFYLLRVKATCSDAAANSPWSDTSHGLHHSTAPTAAGAPTNLLMDAASTTGIWFSWSAGSSGDCVFSRFLVELRHFTGIWLESPTGCEDLDDPSTEECRIENLVCGKNYQLRVKTVCEDTLANSPWSTVLYAGTLTTGCTVTTASQPYWLPPPTPAPPPGTPPPPAPPPGSTSEQDTHNRQVLFWTSANVTGSCEFLRWQVLTQYRVGTVESQWYEVPGCKELQTRSLMICEAWVTQPEHRFIVQETCSDPKADSALSYPSPWRTRILQAALAPTNVTLSNATQTTLKLTWIAGEPHDCLFKHYKVKVSTVVPDVPLSWTQDPMGCSLNNDRIVTECSLQNLALNTAYTATVTTVCIRSSADSNESVASNTAVTLPATANLPGSISIGTITNTGARVQFTAGNPVNDCTFVRWQLEAQRSGSRSWFIPVGADASGGPLQTRTTTLYAVTDLSCGTTYTFRMREVCQNDDATGAYIYSAAITTTGGGLTCSTRSTPPSEVVAQHPTASSLFVTFTPGLTASGSCTFRKYEVHYRQHGTVDWIETFAGDCVKPNAVREDTACTADGLLPDTYYWFRVRQECVEATLSSQWAVSEKAARTLPAIPLEIVEKMPNGHEVSSPSHLYLIFSEPVTVAPDQMTASSWATGCQATVQGSSLWVQYGGTDGLAAMYSDCNAVARQTADTLQMFDCCGSTTVSCAPNCVQQTELSTQIRICPRADVALCNCFTAEVCQSECMLPDAASGLSLLSDQQVLQYQFPEGNPKLGCTYDVSIDLGVVRTLRSPPRFLPQITWNFTHLPATPRMLSAVSVGATTTTIALSVVWSDPCSFTCTTIPGSIVSTAGQSTGIAATTVFFEGLQPGSGYTIECTATSSELDTITGSSSQCCFRTTPDSNARLSSLQVLIDTMCTGSVGASTLAYIAPMFDPDASGQAYTAVVDISEYKSTCLLDASQTATAFYRVALQVTTASQYATVVPVGEKNSSSRPILLEFPGGAIPSNSVNQTIEVEVRPYNGGQSAWARYPVTVIGSYNSLQIESVTTSVPYVLPTDGSATLSVICLLDGSMVATMPLNQFQIKLGVFPQTTTLGSEEAVTVNGVLMKRFTLIANAASAYGFDLPVIIAFQSQEYPSDFVVSFSGPIVSSVTIYTDGVQTQYASVLANSELRVHGQNFGSGSGLQGARIRVATSPNMVSELLYLQFTFAALPLYDGIYSVIQAGHPFPSSAASVYETVCDRTKPMWHRTGQGVLCWTADSKYKYLHVPSASATSPTTIAIWQTNSSTYSADPTAAILVSNTDVVGPVDATGDLKRHLSYRLTFSGVFQANDGAHNLILPDSILWHAHASAFTNCSTTIHRWASAPGSSGHTSVLCWVQDANQWDVYWSDGTSVTLIGTITCSTGFNNLPILCSAPTGSIASISGYSGRRLRENFFDLEEPYDEDGPPARRLTTDSAVNLCGSTTFISSTELRCSLSPSVQASLYAEIEVQSAGGAWTGAWLLDAWGEGTKIQMQPATMTSVSPSVQEWRAFVSLTIEGTDFPPDSMTLGWLQIWASARTVRPTLPVDTANYFPLCTSTFRSSATAVVCSRSAGLNGNTLKTMYPNLWMQESETLFSSMATGLITIPNINVTSITRNTEFELTPLKLTLEGTFPIENWNGAFTVSIIHQGTSTPHSTSGIDPAGLTNVVTICEPTTLADVLIKCEIRGHRRRNTLFDGLFEDSAYDHAAPYHQYPFDLLIEFNENTDPSVPDRLFYRQTLYAELARCPGGQHRTKSKRLRCTKCAKGRAKLSASPQLDCPICPIGSFSSQTESKTCTECLPANFSTTRNGSTSRKKCVCAPGYFSVPTDISRRRRSPWATGFCELCPTGSVCEGSKYRPYSDEGYWSPGRRIFWECHPNQCLRASLSSLNNCADSQDPLSIMCANCADRYYRYRGECLFCTDDSNNLAMAGPGGLLLFLILLFIPAVVRYHSRKNLILKLLDAQDEAADKEKEEEKIKDLQARGMRNASVHVKKEKKKKQAQQDCMERIIHALNPYRVCRRLPLDQLPNTLQEIIAHGRLRMVALIFNKFQLMWALYLMPYKWPELILWLNEWFSVFVFDINFFRPECLYKLTFEMKLLIQWIFPFFITFIIWLGIKVHSCIYRHPKNPKYIFARSTLRDALSIQAAMQLMAHFADDLVFVGCSPCQAQDVRCLDAFPVLYCDAAEAVYAGLVGLSIADIAFVICPTLTYIFIALKKSWDWQHGKGSGVDKHGHLPWHVWVSEFWVQGYKGYTEKLREEALHLGETLRELKSTGKFENLDQVWDRCLYMMKMEKWRQSEKAIEILIFKVIDASLSRRRILDANIHEDEDVEHFNIFSKKGLKTWLLTPLKVLLYCVRCRCLRREKKDGALDALKQEKMNEILKKKSSPIKRCCKCLKACLFGDLPNRPLPRHKRANPYLSEEFQAHKEIVKARKVAEAGGGPRIRSKGYREMTLEDHAKEAAAIEKDMIAKKLHEAAYQKKQDLHQLLAILSQTDEFIREVEHCGGILDSDSMFWCYSWEYTLLIQKMLTVMVCRAAPAAQAQRVMSACMFFQVLVLVACVDLEPFELNFLNDVEMVVDLFMLYVVLLAQLDWSWAVEVVSVSMVVVAVSPLVLRAFLPSIPEGKCFDKAGHVVPAPPQSHTVDLAIVLEKLGPNGLRRVKTVQRRIKKAYLLKHGTQEEREEAAKQLKIEKAKLKKAKQKVDPLEPTLRERIEALPKTLKGPVEAVAKVGWAKITWPSNFTAVHLAANAGNVDAICILHELGAELTTADQWSLTPIDYAEQGGHEHCVKKIRELDVGATAQRLPTRSRAAKAARQVDRNDISAGNVFQDSGSPAEPSPDKIGQPLEHTDTDGELRPLMSEPAPKSRRPRKDQRGGLTGSKSDRGLITSSGKGGIPSSRSDKGADGGVITTGGDLNVRGHVLKKGKRLPEHMVQRQSVWHEPGVQQLLHKEVHGYEPEPPSLIKQQIRAGSRERRERPAKNAMSAPLMN